MSACDDINTDYVYIFSSQTNRQTDTHTLPLASAVLNYAFNGLGCSSMAQLKPLPDNKVLITCHCSYETLLQLSKYDHL